MGTCFPMGAIGEDCVFGSVAANNQWYLYLPPGYKNFIIIRTGAATDVNCGVYIPDLSINICYLNNGTNMGPHANCLSHNADNTPGAVGCYALGASQRLYSTYYYVAWN